MNLNRLSYFAAVVDTGSFTRAAERLGITKAVVSQQVALLEKELQTDLLVRTTRSVQPTEAGRRFHARCLSILREAEDAYDELAQTAVEPSGTLRITAPHDYGTAVVAAVAAAFIDRYPHCGVELSLSDETVDLVAGGMDLAIRVGWLVDSNLLARKIAAFDQLVVAAPEFLDRNQPPQHPSDLERMPFLAHKALQEPAHWRFTRSGEDPYKAQMQIKGAVDTTLGVLAMVKAQAGFSILPEFVVAEDIQSGTLRHVLPDWQLRAGGIFAVYPATRFRPIKVSAFVDMLIAAEKQEKPTSAG